MGLGIPAEGKRSRLVGPYELSEEEPEMEQVEKSGQCHGLSYIVGMDTDGDRFVAVRVPAGHPWEGIDDLWRQDPMSDIGLRNPFWKKGGWWAVKYTADAGTSDDAIRHADALAERVAAVAEFHRAAKT
jgi:hypothetical protein